MSNIPNNPSSDEELEEEIKVSLFVARLHMFASQYGWTEEQLLKTKYSTVKQLEYIIRKGMASLDEFVDINELKYHKVHLRAQGVKQKDLRKKTRADIVEGTVREERGKNGDD
jgi:hypothetical protein